MSRPGAPSGEPSGIKEKPEPRRKIPIARSLNRLHSAEFWKVFWDAFDAHYIYARSGTLHGNINPNAIYMDRTTGRGFLVDWEYRTHVVAPGGYIPLRSSTTGLDTWCKPTPIQEILDEVAKKKADALQSRTNAELKEESDDEEMEDSEQATSSTAPPSHGCEAEDPAVDPAVDSAAKGSELAA